MVARRRKPADAWSQVPFSTFWAFAFPAQPMTAAPGERFWVTVIQPGDADDKYGKYEYVPDGARKMLFEMPKEDGDYELRLHANYPTKSTNVVQRVKIHVGD